MQLYELVLKEPGHLIWATFHMGDRMPNPIKAHNWLDGVLVTSSGGYIAPGGSVSCTEASYVLRNWLLRNWSDVRCSSEPIFTLRSMGAEEFYFSKYKGVLYEWIAKTFNKELRNVSLLGRERYPDSVITKLAASEAMEYWPSPGPFPVSIISRLPSCNDIRCPAVINGGDYVDVRVQAV